METRYVCTPWGTTDELLEVRQQLYGLGDENVDSRQNAVERVQAWEERGEVPLVVNSTTLLVEAILFDDVKNNISQLAIRMTYSAAILRFVTGICDAMQDTKLGKQSMLQIAVLLQLPAELVEARHAISHKELPSLAQLRLAAQLGMEWLWNWYWVKLEDILTELIERPGEEDIRSSRARIQSILKQYLSQRRAEVKRRSKTIEAGKSACKALSGECGRQEELWRMLISLMVDEKLIIPSDKKLSSSMDGAFFLWEDLLQRLSDRRTGFLRDLILHMQDFVIKSTTSSVATNANQEAFCQWIVRMVTSEAWSVAREEYSEDLRQNVMERCLTTPSDSTLTLAREILKHSEKRFAEDWQPFLGFGDEVSAEATLTEQASSRKADELDDEPLGNEGNTLRPYVAGWGRWNGNWSRKSIGT